MSVQVAGTATVLTLLIAALKALCASGEPAPWWFVRQWNLDQRDDGGRR